MLSYKDDEIATLAADVYSDGYIDAKLAIDMHFPFDSKEPVGGGRWRHRLLGRTASGLWQAEGNVHIKIWVISAEVAGLVQQPVHRRVVWPRANSVCRGATGSPMATSAAASSG